MEGATTRFAGRFRPLNQLGDDELAAAVAGGEQRAFGVIFERYHARLYRFCAGVLGDPTLAAEALQRTMLAAIRELKDGKPPIDIRPWLYRLAHEQAVALLSAGAAAEAGAPTEEEGLARQLRELPEEQRAALLLRELNGLEYPEVAAALAMSPWAARRAVREAREALDPIEAERSAARDAQRARELQELFALPAAVASALRESGRAVVGSEDDVERSRHRVLVAFLLIAVAIASTAALAALGTFDSGRGGAAVGNRPEGATPIQVSPGGAQGLPGGSQAGAGSSPGTRGASQGGSGGTGAASPGGAPGSSLGSSQASSPGATQVAPGGTAVPLTKPTSAAAGYSTPGERTEGALGGG